MVPLGASQVGDGPQLYAIPVLTPKETAAVLCTVLSAGSELAGAARCCTPVTGLNWSPWEGSPFPSAPCSALQSAGQLSSHATAAGW